jgi:GH25 family lysozyme M1 (1,4-beta-N-acetylmuramidase)
LRPVPALAAAVLLTGLLAAPAAAGATDSGATGISAARGPSSPAADHAGSTLRSRHSPALASSVAMPALTNTATRTIGMDVSSWQGTVDWAAAARNGARFAYVKATEDTSYQNPYFAQQYDGAYHAGLIRGAYHFGRPDRTSAVAQADYFVQHGGRWTADGRTLPPALDIEYNPYGAACYGLSQAAMTAWLRAFSNEVHARGGRYPVIYSTTDWWQTCTGNSASVAPTDRLWIANWNGAPGVLPAGWRTWKIWQYADSGVLPGDQDVFAGGLKPLRAFAANR